MPLTIFIAILRVMLLTLLICAECAATSRKFVSHPFYLFGMERHFSAALGAADFDSDGDNDIVVANGRHWPQENLIYFNNSKGRLLESVSLGNRNTPSYVVLPHDINGDGKLDVFVINDKLPVDVFIQGDNGFVSSPKITVGQKGMNARGATLSDLNSDGNADLIVALRNQPDVVFYQSKQGQFGEATQLTEDSTNSTSVAASDIDQDGKTDLVFASRGGPSFALLGDGKGNFRWLSLGVDGDFRDVVATDINGDNLTDLVFAGLDQANPVLLGQGKGRFKQCTLLGPSNTPSASVAVADLNRDGSPDFVFGNVDKPSQVFLQTSFCEFSEITLESVVADVYDVQAVDMNKDNYPELLFAISGEANQILLNMPNRP